MLNEGLIVMCTGMGVVFSFLVILVAAMFVMSAIVAKLNEKFPVVVAQAQGAKKAVSAVGEDIAVAIAAVLNRR